MLVLDTNVISELFKPAPDQQVIGWMSRQTGDALFTTAITHGELLFGLHCMPEGRRKALLLKGVLRIFESRLAGRILDYDSDAANAYALIAAGRRALGRPIHQADAMIAGIVRSRNAQLVTRNGRDFEGCDIGLIDPWR